MHLNVAEYSNIHSVKNKEFLMQLFKTKKNK